MLNLVTAINPHSVVQHLNQYDEAEQEFLTYLNEFDLILQDVLKNPTDPTRLAQLQGFGKILNSCLMNLFKGDFEDVAMFNCFTNDASSLLINLMNACSSGNQQDVSNSIGDILNTMNGPAIIQNSLQQFYQDIQPSPL